MPFSFPVENACALANNIFILLTSRNIGCDRDNAM